MALNEKKLAQAAVTSAVTTVYTVPTGARALIKTFDLCNNSLIHVRKATVYFVPSGASPADSNTIVPNVDLEPRSMLQWTGLQVLNAGDSVQVTANDSDVTLNMSGAENVL